MLKLRTLLTFLIVIFLTGCNLFGPMPLLKDDQEEVYEPDESLLIPPDVINTTMNDSILFTQTKTYIDPSPSNLECYVVTSEGREGCEGFWTGD
tara:strand:- start:80 stop:361 length:282 start_codon:yes stop_codon:yes gene_type:complete